MLGSGLSGTSICRTGTMARGDGMRLEFEVALKTIWGSFSTEGGYMVHV